MQSKPMPPASVSPSSSSSPDVPIAGPYLLHGLPMQIMEKRQRSAPRPRSPLRSQICVDEEEELQEVDNKQLEDSEVLAVSVPPVHVSQVPNAAANAATGSFDPFTAYDPDCFEDLGLEDVEIGFDIRIVDDEGKETETTMATAGGAVERAGCLSGSATAAPVLSATVSSARPVSVSDQGRADSGALQRPPLRRTNEAHVPESDSATTATSALPLPFSTSAPVGLGLLELATSVNVATDADAAAGPGNNANANSGLVGDVCVGAEDEPVQTMQLMTLESSSSISCLAAPMVPPSISVSGPSGSAASGGRGRIGGGSSSSGSGGGMMPPSLSAAASASASGAPNASNGTLSTSSGSLREPPVQEMCAPTAVMPGPSPTLVRTAPRIPSPEAVEDISVDILQLSATIDVEQMDVAAEPTDGDGDEAGYIGNRMLKSSAAIEKWRLACVDADRDVDSDSDISSTESDSESGHPAVERRDDIAHAVYRDEPVGRRDASPLSHAHSLSDSITITTVATESSFDIVESSSSCALKAKKSVEGLGLGLPSEVPGVVVSRAASLAAPNLRLEEDPIMMSTAPGCMNLAALAREDVDLDPTNSNVGSPAMMTSEVREGTQFFTRAPVYGKRLLWRVEEEDQEDLALFEFDEEEELKKLDETVRKMKSERGIGQSSSIPIPRLALGAGVGAGARALSGAWSRISSLVLSSPAGISQYDADVEEGGDVHEDVRAVTTATVNSLSRPSSTSEAAFSSHESLSEEQVPLVTAEARPALEDVPLSSASASLQRPAPRRGYMSSFMSRISLTRSSSSTSSSSPVSVVPTSPTGRKSPGFVEHVDAPRGLGLGRLGAAAVKRFQMLF